MAVPELKGIEIEYGLTPVDYLVSGKPFCGGIEIEFPDIPLESEKKKVFVAGVKQKVFEEGVQKGVFA